MNEQEIKKNIKEIIDYTCNRTILSFRGINENTIYNEFKKRNMLNDFVNATTSEADCMIFNLLNEL